jgi:uncharacterized membrane protein (DUF2068 family)
LGGENHAESDLMNEQPSRLPLGLRTIALFEAAKGLLALAAVCGVLSLRHTDLHAVTDAFLLRHGVNPERHYTRLFIETVARVTNHHAGQLAAVGIAYAVIRIAEGYGLWRGKHWAEWFAVISAGLYLPLELVHFARRPRPFTAGIILLNIVLIYYLGKLLARQRAERKSRLSAKMKSVVSVLLVLAFAAVKAAGAADAVQTEEDLKRKAAIAEFAAKRKAANYPALFDAAAKEFKVPADILKGVAFAETRWEQLMWPPAEAASPETGMPRPCGIMSLWDNKRFGHSLIEAAALIGKTTDELKQDAYQNIRGGAALLRQIYDANPKPEGTTAADIESWRYAIRKYCGIPEPDLNARHVLDIYVFISQGYHQYGIEWEGRLVNLEPIREETRRIVAEEEAKREARMAANSNMVETPAPQLAASPEALSEPPMARNPNRPAAPPAAPVAEAAPGAAQRWKTGWMILLVLAVVAGSYLLQRLRSRSDRS